MKTYIGIDPGFSGAMACLYEVWDTTTIEYNKLDVVDMPIIKATKNELDEAGIVAFFELHEPDMVVIEKSQTMPGQGISSTGRYMESYGRIRGICAGMKIPYTLIHPRTWKRVMMADMGKEKGESILRTKQLFPHVELPLKKDHGKADACLIAEYGRRMNL